MFKTTTSTIAEVLLTTKWVLSSYKKIAPRLTVIFFLAQGLSKLEGIIYAYLFGVVLDKIISIIALGSTRIEDFIPTALALVAVRFIFAIVSAVSSHTSRLIQIKSGFALRVILYERLRALGVANLENSEVANRAQRFSEIGGSIYDHLVILVRIFSNTISLLTALGIVIVSAPGIIPIFLVSVAISWFIDQRFVRLLWNFNLSSTEARRKAFSSAHDLSESSTLKELITTGGYHYLHKKFEGFVGWYFGGISRIRKNWVLMGIFSNAVELIAYFIGMLFIFQKLLKGIITVGQLTFQLRSLAIFAESMSATALEFVSIRESSIRLSDALGLFFKYKPDVDGKEVFNSLLNPPTITFKNITFSYPNSTKPVIKNLDLKIDPGEKVAIVGENGAGKTTLVKLILRTYRPQKGNIMLNDQDLNALLIDSWHKNIGVLFQDFNQYVHMTVKENVGIGDINKDLSDEKINLALKLADAYDFVKKYPDGLEQLLGEKFKGGIRPSTGQWQKIAIARFFFRDSPVLVLDEPTASIDAVAEAQIFDNIYKFIKNKTVIIISHRFSTVRNADRIIVLDRGRIIEEGSHNELIKKKGKYAKAFKLQARGYE